MVTTVQSWVLYLQQSGALLGLPLLLTGVVLAWGGWRIRKGAIPISYGLAGILIALMLAKGHDPQWFYALAGFIVMTLIGFLLRERAAGFLGGLIGAGIVNYAAEHFGLSGPVLWVVTAIGMAVFSALSFIDLRQVVILITSFEGAVLVVSAGAAFFAHVPWVAERFRGTTGGWSLVAAFVLLVPTVIGSLVQMADAKQQDCGVIEW
ncbi:MAG TPA: hypothetical protein VM243_00425 [Phycisphaerae bacterium]|nr:hypothetical protein [Phycisphaerae bacterium]